MDLSLRTLPGPVRLPTLAATLTAAAPAKPPVRLIAVDDLRAGWPLVNAELARGKLRELAGVQTHA